jgi:hypothetical protein
MVLRDLRIYEGAAMPFEPFVCPFLIRSHQT